MAVDRPTMDKLLYDFLLSTTAMEKHDIKVWGLDWPAQLTLKSLDRGPVPMKEIGDLLGWEPFQVSRLADRLERERILLREPSRKDRRKTLLNLTDLGRSKLETIRQAHFEQLIANLETMNADDQRALVRALELLPRALKPEENKETK